MTASSRSTAWLPVLWSALLATLLLGPALAPGYVLTYDMVWVPDLALRPDFLGVGSALPRAVPSDAVVAVLDELVPGMVLQKLVLLGALVAAGAGAARLGPKPGAPGALVGRLAAASAAVWGPFVAERLLLGHWPVLLCYAALPWVVLAARRARRESRVGAALLGLVLVGSLSANAGLMTAVAVLAFALDPRRPGYSLRLVAVLVLSNAPWLVTGLLHASEAVVAPVAATVFALNGTEALPPSVNALALGGVWNTEVVLPSRDGAAAWLGVAALVVLGALGARSVVRRWPLRDVTALGSCWVAGWLLAVLTWATPDAIAWLAGLPGGGLLRDGSRWLALCLPAVAAAVGHGAAVLAGRLPAGVPRGAAAVALLLWPVAVLPDAAWGLGGRLAPVAFPEEYAEARATVEAHRRDRGRGDVLLLPFTSYRAPEWNGGRKVLDPLGRYLPGDFVASDVLVVDGTALPGEDPRARDVDRALRLPEQERASALARLGVGLVVEERPGGAVEVTALTGVVEEPVPRRWWLAAGAAWAAYLLVPVSALLLLLLAGKRR